MTQALSPTTVSSGASHQRSVRNVFAAIVARGALPPGRWPEFVTDCVIGMSFGNGARAGGGPGGVPAM